MKLSPGSSAFETVSSIPASDATWSGNKNTELQNRLEHAKSNIRAAQQQIAKYSHKDRIPVQLTRALAEHEADLRALTATGKYADGS